MHILPPYDPNIFFVLQIVIHFLVVNLQNEFLFWLLEDLSRDLWIFPDLILKKNVFEAPYKSRTPQKNLFFMQDLEEKNTSLGKALWVLRIKIHFGNLLVSWGVEYALLLFFGHFYLHPRPPYYSFIISLLVHINNNNDDYRTVMKNLMTILKPCSSDTYI